MNTMSPGEAAAMSLERGSTRTAPDRGDAWIAALGLIARIPGAGEDTTCTVDPDSAARALDVQAARAALGMLLEADARLTARLPSLIETERLTDLREAGICVALTHPGNRLSGAMIDDEIDKLPEDWGSCPTEVRAHSRPLDVLNILDGIDVKRLTVADIGYLAGALLIQSGDLKGSAQSMVRILGSTLAKLTLEVIQGMTQASLSDRMSA